MAPVHAQLSYGYDAAVEQIVVFPYQRLPNSRPQLWNTHEDNAKFFYIDLMGVPELWKFHSCVTTILLLLQ